MNENLFEAQYDVTKKSKLKKFYEKHKVKRIIVKYIMNNLILEKYNTKLIIFLYFE